MTFDDENGLPPGLLGEMMGEVVRNTKEKGWYDTDRTWGDDIALLHSEISEALEAFRDNGTADATTLSYENSGDPPKPEGVGSEFADVLIRMLDTGARYELPLSSVPPNPNHFRIGETFGDAITALHLQVALLGHAVQDAWRLSEMNNVWGCLQVVADKFGIDLMAEYRRKAAYNTTRPHRHGGRAL